MARACQDPDEYAAHHCCTTGLHQNNVFLTWNSNLKVNAILQSPVTCCEHKFSNIKEATSYVQEFRRFVPGPTRDEILKFVPSSGDWA